MLTSYCQEFHWFAKYIAMGRPSKEVFELGMSHSSILFIKHVIIGLCTFNLGACNGVMLV
jgi:hypothetical protein